MVTAFFNGGAKTCREYWEATPAREPRASFWSPFDPTFSDVLRLLRKHVTPGSSFVELGFAPGKYLAYVGSRLKAQVSGVDYSPAGVATARRLFSKMGQAGDLRCEDAFRTSLPERSFDIVFSNGLIEHFDDPRPLIERHIRLAKPDGKVIVLIPNYGGVYGRAQARLDPDNLAVHNLSIMSRDALADLFPGPVETMAFGRPTLWGVSLKRPALQRAAGMIGRALPTIPALAPMLAAVYHPEPSSVQTKSAAPPLLFSR